MSISMNNHESRIVALENKIGSGGGIIESSLSNPGYIKFANGLIINFGKASLPNDKNTTLTFYKSFTNKCLLVIGSIESTGNYYYGNKNDFVWFNSFNLTNCKAYVGPDRQFDINFIAIGYLVSNRVKCLFKGVISYVNLLK